MSPAYVELDPARRIWVRYAVGSIGHRLGDFVRKTRLLRNLLEHHQTQLSAEEFQNLQSETERMIEVYISTLKQEAPGARRAAMAHRLIEEQNQNYANVATSCTKGCGACCHLEVEITQDDAARVAEVIRERGVIFDETRMFLQAQRERLDGAWRSGMASLSNRCVMLGDDLACRIYDARPATCRKHSVVSLASECSAEGGAPVPRVIPLNEIIMSAQLNLEGHEFGSFSKLVSAALAERAIAFELADVGFVLETTVATEEPAPNLAQNIKSL